MSPRRLPIAILSAAPMIVACVLPLAGCRTQPMLDTAPIYSPLAPEQNRQAILRGLAAHRWRLVADEPGLITARQDKQGKHVATVDIAYDDSEIDIRYKSSHGLRCEPTQGGTSCASIHRAYNRWVVQLSRDIEFGIRMVQIESQGGAVGAQ